MRRRSAWLWAGALAAYAFLYLPLVIVVVYSFNDSRLNAEWVGFTLDWYRKLAADNDMLKAADKAMTIEHVRLVSKIGGKSGDYHRAFAGEVAAGSPSGNATTEKSGPFAEGKGSGETA